MSSKAKAVFGNHPFTEGKKTEPIYMDSSNIGQFIYPDFGLDYSDLNYMYYSSDTLTICSMEIGPGGFFNPPDYHPGDEAYFVLEGTITQFNPATGCCIEVKEGEALLIPKGALHSAYNFGEKKVKVLAVIAPKIVESQEFPTDVNGPKKILGYAPESFNAPTEDVRLPFRYGSIDQLGEWPEKGEFLREKSLIYHITEERKLKVIHGDTRPILMKYSVSNDFMNVGEYIVPAGGVVTRRSEPVSHDGDTFLLGVDGTVAVYMTKTRETYMLKHYEGLYIPAGAEYMLLNYESVTGRIIFATANYKNPQKS